MSSDEHVGIFTQNYSLPKILVMELALLMGAVLPLVPSFAAKPNYTRIFFVWPFYLVVILACLTLGLLSVAMIPVLWRAIMRRPAIEITGDQIIVHSNWEKRGNLSQIVNIMPSFGNVLIEFRHGKKFAAPIFLCERPSAALEHLLAAAPASVRGTGLSH